MAENKTQPTDQSVDVFIDKIDHEQRRNDSRLIIEMMQKASQSAPRMWGESIIGFGDVHYKYATGREGDSFLVGFSPRKQNLTLYLTCGINNLEEELKRLGKHKTSVSCLYINKLSDVNLSVLEEIIQKSVEMGPRVLA